MSIFSKGRGPQGPTGASGSAGSQGPTGATGPEGPPIVASGSVATTDATPTPITTYALEDGYAYSLQAFAQIIGADAKVSQMSAKATFSAAGGMATLCAQAGSFEDAFADGHNGIVLDWDFSGANAILRLAGLADTDFDVQADVRLLKKRAL